MGIRHRASRRSARAADRTTLETGRRAGARTALRRLACGAAALGVASLGVTALATPSSGAAPARNSAKTTVSVALAPGTAVDYVFPFEAVTKDSIYNVDYFQYSMYRPLYWFGKGSTPDLSPKLSVARTAAFSNGNKTVTISLKTYKWSNGTAVDATDVMFFLNMYHAEKTMFYGYVPGGLSIPDSITGVKVTNPKTVTISLDRSFNTHWFVYNQLSQVTPLPLAWTKTSTTAAAGSAGCAKAAFGTDDAACAAVYKFLSGQAGFNPTHPTASNDSLATYATNPLWQVVDGPFHMTSFVATGDVTLAPNPKYSGPVKPAIKRFQLKPFTSTSAEFDALASGSIDVGYLPTTDITANAKSDTVPGPNNPRLASAYTLRSLQVWGITYAPYNFESTGQNGQDAAIFKQDYFREAMQSLVDQPLLISRLMHGYAAPEVGPVPLLPKSPFVSKYEESTPYPYSVNRAKQLLTSHGWKVVKDGTDVCEKPGKGSGKCGAGIKKGAKLAVTMNYSVGTLEKNMMAAMKGAWALAGIQVTTIPQNFNVVYSTDSVCSKGCPWQMGWWGGWTYSPDFYPTGEVLFSTGALSNSGSYSTAKADSLINKTDFTSASLTAYENYLAKYPPVIWLPHAETPLEVHKGLTNPTQLNPLGAVTAALFRWKK